MNTLKLCGRKVVSDFTREGGCACSLFQPWEHTEWVEKAAFDQVASSPRRAFGGIKTAKEALDLLSQARAELVAKGFQKAVELATAHGTVRACEVWAALRPSLSDPELDKSARWLGAVFKGKPYAHRWEKVGVDYGFGDTERNSHAAPRAIWKLRQPCPPAPTSHA